ncbi:hypothetical protein GCM10009863_59840 [Streptomyces axinellae]|uniref:Uncharacterized protein n=1 Tax=Streptomyces axinellae TaxID=552788 RepID=A0ABP6D4B1_9ACTN
MLGMDRLDTVGERGIGRRAFGAGRSRCPPFVEAGAVDLQHVTQPLDRVGLAVVLNELEAAYQCISEAKNDGGLRRLPAGGYLLIVSE